MGGTFIAAAAQLAPVFLDRDATVDKACAAIREAGRVGARLIVFPETFIPGYPYWTLVQDPLTSRNRFFRPLFEQAVTVPGPAVTALCAAARDAQCFAVVGINEREGGTLYNTQLFLGDDGSVLGRHRKLVPTHHERMTWGRGDGADMGVFQTALGTLGGLICYEHANALFRYAIQAQGEDIHIANWPGGMPWIDEIVDAAIRHYAFEGQCFVVSTTAILTPAIIAALGDGGSVGRLRPGGGCSAIVAPGGRYLARADADAEAVIYAEIDRTAITDWKQLVDSTGHYARPDVVRLHLARRARRPLVIDGIDACSDNGDHIP